MTVDDVSVRFGEVAALSSVTVDVSPGRFVGLIGPNGAGKTTLLRTISGALTPDVGAVRVGDMGVDTLSSRAASRAVAVVPQDTSVAFDFAVREIIAMGRTPYVDRFGRGERAGSARVEAAMARTDVAHLADRSISAISGGERQRVLLARAIAQATPVLLLDEPTGSLDVNHQSRTLELVRTLVEDGKTVIAAIHDLNLAARYCDELVLLDEGQLVAHDEPGHVLTRHHLRSVFDARTAVRTDPVTGAREVTALPDSDDTRNGRIHVIGGGGAATRSLYELAGAGYELSVGATSCEDADVEAARQLGLEVVTVPPNSPIDEATQATVTELVRAADRTVVPDIALGPGNLPNLAAASRSDRVVLVEDRPLDARNYAGEPGADRYRSLRKDAVVVPPAGLMDAVAADLGEQRVGATGESEPAIGR